MKGKTAADAGRRYKEAVDCPSGTFDVHNQVEHPNRVVRIVANQVAFVLQLRERLPKIPHRFGKRQRHILAARLGLPMLRILPQPGQNRRVQLGFRLRFVVYGWQ